MNTVLFDLDGTLLQMEMDRFMQLYMTSLTKAFQPHMNPELFQSLLWKGTKKMLENPGKTITNEKVFYEAFFEEYADRQELIDVFDHFYETAFEKTQQATSSDEYMIQAVKLLGEKGYRLAVATNPLFPLKAVERRIQWAGLSPQQFELITSFETMHSCKPNIAFYREVIEALGVDPWDALMVGNDAYEDVIAGRLGIHTYLVTNCLIQKDQTACEPDYRGSSFDFLQFTERLPFL